MNIRNITLLTFISLAPVHLHGMIEAIKANRSQSPVSPLLYSVDSPAIQKRGPETDLLSPSPEKKAKIDNPVLNDAQKELGADSQDKNHHIESLENTLSDKIKKTINHLDFTALGDLLITNDSAQLDKEQKETLYTQAKQFRTKIKQGYTFEHKIASKNNSEEIEEYSYDSACESIKKISRHLYAFKTLPKLTFPQAFFTKAPRVKHLTQKTTPDQALIALIKNEQRKISVCCFSFDLIPIAEALVRKKRTGVKVEVITDKEQGNKQKALVIIEFLKDNDIEVLSPQNYGYETAHHKFSLFKKNLFNKSLVCNGSFNYSENATENCWEDMTISDDPEMIGAFNNRFKEIKGRSKEFKITQPVERNNNNYYNNNNNYPNRY